MSGNNNMAKIRWYSDKRVLPYKIGTLEERHEDAMMRYRYHPTYDPERFKRVFVLEKELEKQIFSTLSTPPETLTDSYLEAFIADLWDYEVPLYNK